MALSVTEILMGLGDFSVDLNRTAALDDLTALYRLFRLWWGEDLVFAGPILSKKRGRSGITIGGRYLEWYLGLQKAGPMIEDRWYVAGTNKLSNGDFSLDDLYWATSEGSKWAIGGGSALVVTDPVDDDVLQSSETFEAVPGERWRGEVNARNLGAGEGRFRERLVFEGRFDPPELLANPGLEDGGLEWSMDGQVAVVDDVANAHAGTKALQCSPTAIPQLIANPTFDFGLTDWHYDTGPTAPAWFAGLPSYDGPNAVGFNSPTPVTGWLGPDARYTVVPHAKYRYSALVESLGSTDMTVYLSLTLFKADGSIDRYIESDKVTQTAGWQYLSIEFDVPEGDDAVEVYLWVESTDPASNGAWQADLFQLEKLTDNLSTALGPFLSVTPKRPYRVSMFVRAGPNWLKGGTVRPVVLLQGADRPDVFVEGPQIEPPATVWKLVTFDVTPPSGYDFFTPYIDATDIAGDSVFVDDLSVKCTDTTRIVWDQWLYQGTSWYDLWGEFDAPAGTEKVRLELIAEAGGGGWEVDNAILRRVGGPTAAANIVRDLLTAGITEGTIHGAGDIGWDWHIRNLTSREALLHISTGGLIEPEREWVITPDGRLSWGLSSELFVVATRPDGSPLILSADDLVLMGQPTGTVDVEDEVEIVKLVGADRKRPDGSDLQITGRAFNPVDGVDLAGDPLERMEVVEDSRVDHVGYANAYAADLASHQRARAAQKFTLSDWRAAGRFRVGDWLTVDVPEAGLDGLTRVLSRELRPGPGGFRAEIMVPGGTPVDVTEDVLWNDDTTAIVELGDFLAEFARDPQGPQTGNQYLQWRTSRTA